MKSVFHNILNIIFVLSGLCLTTLLSMRGSNQEIAISLFFSLFIFIYLAYKFRIVERFLHQLNINVLLLSVILAHNTSKFISNHTYWNRYNEFNSILLKLGYTSDNIVERGFEVMSKISFLSLFTFSIFMYFILKITVNHIKSIFDSFNKTDWIIFSIIMSLCVIVLVVVYNQTVAFNLPMKDGKIIMYDVIYTSDTPTLLQDNVFFNVNSFENDIRQPLFGLFTLPFGSLVDILSRLFKFPQAQVLFMGIIQSFFIVLTGFSLDQMFQKEYNVRYYLLGCFILSFPTILFILNIEQYGFAVFWLIALLSSQRKNLSFFFMAATGSMVTSGISIVLLAKSKKPITWIKEVIQEGLKLLACLTIFGQLPLLLGIFTSVKTLLQFSGEKLGLMDKVAQYFNFIKTCFIYPKSHVNTTMFDHISFQLDKVEYVSILGIIILIVAIFGFLVNTKSVLSRISLSWVIFSFLILVGVGWGTAENGLVLYTYYFAWAFQILVLKAMLWVVDKLKLPKQALLITFLLVLFLVNIQGFSQLVQFAIKNYPL